MGGVLVFGRSRPRWQSRQGGHAVRRDWPCDGTHEFVGLHPTEAGAGWFAVSDRAYWRRGPLRPTHSVVEISLRDFNLHVTESPAAVAGVA